MDDVNINYRSAVRLIKKLIRRKVIVISNHNCSLRKNEIRLSQNEFENLLFWLSDPSIVEQVEFSLRHHKRDKVFETVRTVIDTFDSERIRRENIQNQLQ